MALTEQDVAECLKILQKLKRNRESAVFRAPVDPVKEGIPTYFNVVTSPMDLSTVESDRYMTVHDFAADIRLIWSNAELFNGPTHFITTIAKNLDVIFTAWYEDFLKKRGGGSPSKVVAQEMTHEEKAALCAKVAQASPKQIGQVVVTIHKYMPGIFKGTGSEVQEVDINIDLLSVAALREIAAILAESS